MSVIDLILNIVGLLLWLKWRDKGREVSPPSPGISLLGTLRRAESKQSSVWFLILLLVLLSVRPFIYWMLGSSLGWTPQISLGVITFPFRSDLLGRMFLYSFFSFGVAFGVLYLSLLLLSIIGGKRPSSDPVQNATRAQLGRIDSLPTIFKLMLPWFLMAALWCALNKPLVALGMLPAPKSIAHLAQQGFVVGLSVYLAWKYLIVGILLLHLLNSYIYFGTWPFWTFVDNSARQILKLISWIPLRIGKIDFAPLIGIAAVLVAAEFASRGLVLLYQRLPL